MEIGSGMKWPVKEIFDVKNLAISLNFLTNDAEISGGTASIVVNGLIRRNFNIPAQLPRFYGPGIPCWITATNWSNPFER